MRAREPVFHWLWVVLQTRGVTLGESPDFSRPVAWGQAPGEAVRQRCPPLEPTGPEPSCPQPLTQRHGWHTRFLIQGAVLGPRSAGGQRNTSELYPEPRKPADEFKFNYRFLGVF